MAAELNTMVDNGCTVVDVIVEHPLYGQLTGPLQLSSRYDVAQFIARSHTAQPLSVLTGGIHLHTLLCPSEDAYGRYWTPCGRRLPAGGIKLSVDKHTDSVYSVLDRCQDTSLTHYF